MFACLLALRTGMLSSARVDVVLLFLANYPDGPLSEPLAQSSYVFFYTFLSPFHLKPG